MKHFYLIAVLFFIYPCLAQETSGEIEQDGVIIKYEFQKTESEKKKDVYALAVTAENTNNFDVYYRGASTELNATPSMTNFGGVRISNTKGFLAATMTGLTGDRTEYFTTSNEPLFRIAKGKRMSTGMNFKVKTGAFPAVTDYFEAALKPLEFYTLRSDDIPLPFTGADFAMTRFDKSGSTMPAGQTLYTNQMLSSPNQQFYMNVLADGNVCVMRRTPRGVQDEFAWCAGTHGQGANTLTLQEDGNLVIYNRSNQPVWSSSTTPYYDNRFNSNSYKPVSLQLEDNGALNLYSATGQVVWSSANDNAAPEPVAQFPFQGANLPMAGKSLDGNMMPVESELNIGDAMVSQNQQFYVTLQADGNLVVYQKNRGADSFVWGTMTQDQGGKQLRFQRDGNLVLYDNYDDPIWATNTMKTYDSRFGEYDYKPAKLFLDNYGRLVMRSATGQVVWNTN